MASTFSWVQYTGTGTTSNLQQTSSGAGMSWDFETQDSAGTQSYTAAPVSAGSNSWPVWLKGWWSNGAGFTVTNYKFWQWTPTASNANTATFGIWGTWQAAYTPATGTASGTNYASNVQVPLGTASTAAPTNALSLAASTGSGGAGAVALNSFIALQLTASSAAPAGTTGYFGFTLQYDEQ